MNGIDLYFSEHFGVDAAVLQQHGAFDISIVSDFPLFIDPFLLFNSHKPEYQLLHEQILRYLRFLREKASPELDPGLIKSWYRFKEVKQNWLGFTVLGNGGSGLGAKFATSLHESLSSILNNFGSEKITASSHLERLALIQPGVGRDSISDFATNLIKDFLLRYTEKFARRHLTAGVIEEFAVTRAAFNFDTESWETRKYTLPRLGEDFVLLTPTDLLTRDDTWISQSDMLRDFGKLPDAVPNDELRAQINNYFRRQLSKKPTSRENAIAAQRTIREFPEIVDYYIKSKEDAGDDAAAASAEKVDDIHSVLVAQLRLAVADLTAKSTFYDHSWTSYDEALERIHIFKAYVEDQDGYKLINRSGKPFSREEEVQLFFGLL